MGLIQNKVTVSQPNSHVVVKNAGGLRGLTGEKGVPGPQGEPGQAATVTAGTTTTLPAGSDATVQNVGSTSAAIFNFGIPKGDTGETGAAATISVGTTTTLEPGEDATVTNSGTSSAAVFDFGIPKGAKGDTGATGADGYSPSATVSKTGDTATITITDKDGTTTASISDGTTPTVNDGTLTIQKNGTTVQTFSADQASNVTANITVPTQFSDLSGTVSSSQIEDEAITTGSVSGTGTNITLAGTMEGGAIESVEMYGDTEQTTYSGKNKAKYNATYSANGIDSVLNSDGSLTCSGTTTTTYFNTLPYQATLPSMLPAGTYTFSRGGDTTYAVQIQLWDSTKNQTLTFRIPAGQTKITDTTTFDAYYYGSSFVYLSANMQINTTVKLQLESGSTATSFEPYVGGTASPNPDYPQEVQTVTGEQTVTVTGKNKINVANGTGTRGNNTVVASGQTVTANTSGGSGTESAWYLNDCSIIQQYAASYSSARDYHLTTEGGTYTITVYYENMPSGTATLHCYVYTNKQAKILNRNMVEGNKIVWTVTLEADEYIKSAMIYTAAANVFSNFKTRIQIEKGSSTTPYVPYQGGSYPLNLGKNLCNPATLTADSRLNGDGTLLSGATGFSTSDYISVEPNTTYTITRDAASSGFFGNLCQYNSSKTMVGTRAYWDNSASYWPQHITTSSTTRYIRVSDQTTLFGTSFQIEKGSTATTYAPYFTPIELCKIGTYRDYIYKSGDNWYIKKHVGKLLFTGAEPWERNVYAGKYYFTRYTTIVGQQYGWSNNFGILTVGGPLTSNVNVIRASQDRIDLIMDGSELSLDDFKDWLSSHNTSYYYYLSTPTDTQITNATLISELEDLLSATTYSGTTYITVSGDLASPLEVVAESDSKLAPDSVYGAAIKDGAVSVDKIADLKALADALAPYLNS